MPEYWSTSSRFIAGLPRRSIPAARSSIFAICPAMGREFGIGNAIRLGQGLDDLVLGRHAEFDQNLAQKLTVPALALLLDGLFDLILGDDSPGDQDLAQVSSRCRCSG